MDATTHKAIGIHVYLFLPLIVSVTVFVFGDGFKRRISSGLSILFSSILWVHVCKATANNPGYMFPTFHAIYPVICASALAAFSIFELFFWYIIKCWRIAKLRNHLKMRGDYSKLKTTDFIAQVSIDDDGRLRIAPRTQSFPSIQKVYNDIMWDAERHDLCSAKSHEWRYLKWYRHITGGVVSSYGCTLMLHPETHWMNVPSGLKSDIESLLNKRPKKRKSES